MAGVPASSRSSGSTGGVWADTSPTLTGFSGTPGSFMKWAQVGAIVFCRVSMAGTSNTTGFTFGLPVAAVDATGQGFYGYARARDNTVFQTVPALIEINDAATIATVYKDGSLAGWTAGGTKAIIGTFFYGVAAS